MSEERRSADYPLGPALEFLERLWELDHALERLSSRMERTIGITAQQRLVVRCVGKYPGIAAGQLAAVLHVDPGTISAALGRLEEKGLIERRRDPRDKRRVTVGLTERGHALDRPAAGTVEHAVERLFAEIGDERVATTAAVLERLSALLASEVHED